MFLDSCGFSFLFFGLFLLLTGSSSLVFPYSALYCGWHRYRLYFHRIAVLKCAASRHIYRETYNWHILYIPLICVDMYAPLSLSHCSLYSTKVQPLQIFHTKFVYMFLLYNLIGIIFRFYGYIIISGHSTDQIFMFYYIYIGKFWK